MESEFLNGDGHEADQFLVMDSSRTALPSLAASPGENPSSSSTAAKTNSAAQEGSGQSKNDGEEGQDAYAVAVAAVNAAAAVAAGIEKPAAQEPARSPSSKKKRKRKGKKTDENGDVNGSLGPVDRNATPPSPLVAERETAPQKETEKGAAADDGKLDSDIPPSSSPVSTKSTSGNPGKRKKKNRQTSQEEESAQALLALNKGLAKSADNEEAIVEDDDDEIDEAGQDAGQEAEEKDVEDESASKGADEGDKPVQPTDGGDAVPEAQEKATEDTTHQAEDQHFLVPADEDVEMAEAAMAVTAATASAALNATAAIELNGSALDATSAPERTISEHLAAHLAKVDSSTMQSQAQPPPMTDDMLVEHRLAVQLQQNGYAAPSMDGHGFVAVNHLASSEADLMSQMNSRPQKKRKRQQQNSHLQSDATLQTEHGLMVDPQLMQLDESTGFALNPTAQTNDPPAKRPRSSHDDPVHSHDTTQPTNSALHAQNPPGGTAAAVGLGNPHLPRSGSWKASTYNSGDLAHGGTFSLEERHAVDLALHQYCLDNDMTMDQLRERVWGNNRRKDEFWDTICHAVPNRSRASVYKHVRRTCHIFQQRAKWSPEEDEELAMLVAEKGNKWKDIGLAMGRMGEDCRDRYRNYVKCGKDRGTDRWSKEEEDLLTATVIAHKEDTKRMLILENKPLPAPEDEDFQLINWTIVSDLMKNRRSRIQCRYKWKKMITQREKQEKAPAGITYEGGKRKKVSYNIEQMLPGDKYWLLRQVQATRANKEGEIPWDDIAKSDKDVIGIWSQKDLKAAYRDLRKDLPFRRRPLRAILDQLLQQFEGLSEDQRTTRFQPTEADRDAAAAASLARSTPSRESPASNSPSGDFTASTAPVVSMTSASASTITSNDAADASHGDSATTAPVLDPVLMAGGALDELEKSTNYNAGLEAAARVVRNAMQAQQAGAASSAGAVSETGQNSATATPSENESPTNSAAEGESQEEQELRRRLLGGLVTENVGA